MGEIESLEPGEVSEAQGMAIADLVGTFTNGVIDDLARWVTAR